MQQIKNWLTPPRFENEEIKTNIAYVLHFVLWLVLVTLVLTFIYFSTWSLDRARNLFSLGFLISVTVLSQWRLQRGNVYTVGRFYLAILWSLSVGYSLATRGILSPYPAIQVVTILLAAIVLSPPYSVLFTVASIISTSALLFISDDLPAIAPYYDADRYMREASSNWFVYVSSFTVTAVMVSYATRLIGQGLEARQQHERELAARNQELEAEIAERERIDSELRASESKFRTLTESALVGIFFIRSTQDTRFVYVNPAFAAIFGYETDEIIGTLSPKDLLHPDDIDRALRRLRDRFSGISDNVIKSYRAFKKDGTEFQIEIASMLVEFAGEPAVMGTLIDVTERARAEEARIALQVEHSRVEFLQEFIGTMTHDLKTPLTVIKTSLYLLDHLADPDHQRKHQARIAEQTEKLAGIIDDILTVARLDSVPELSLKETDINRLVERVREQLKPRAEHKHLTLSYDMAANVPPIPADPEELYRAMVNLVENAINYTPENGAVTVRTFRTNGEVSIEVCDTGIGISEDELPHIFNRFYRAGNAKSLPGGTGLGLAIMKRIIDLHQGEVTVSSTIGKGTTFLIKFPVNASASVPSTLPQ